jgi:hypothetical protein
MVVSFAFEEMIGKRTHLFGIQIAMNGSPFGAFCGFNSWYLVEVRFVAPSRLVFPWAPSGSSDSASRPALWPSRFQSWVKDFLPAVEEKNSGDLPHMILWNP